MFVTECYRFLFVVLCLGLKLKDQSSGQAWKRTATGPIISESDFSRVRASSEVERMVHQVLAVFPDAPQHAIRRDLCTIDTLCYYNYTLYQHHEFSTFSQHLP